MPRALFEKAAFVTALLASSLWGGVLVAQAQTIYISPASDSYYIGQAFSVRVNVSSQTQAVNAVSGTVSFPSDLLQVVSISKTDSIMSLWVQDPSFSNAAGTVDFAGVVLNPGFIGSSGKALTINFKAVNSGQAKVKLVEGSLLANDGQGTNILSSLGSADFDIGAGAAAVEPPPKPVEATSDLVITSDTHPDPHKWYTADTAHFLFQFPDSATETRVSIDKLANTTPLQSYIPAIHEKTVTGSGEGAWYVHVLYKTGKESSPTAHFRFNIDYSAPSNFTIRDGQRLIYRSL